MGEAANHLLDPIALVGNSGIHAWITWFRAAVPPVLKGVSVSGIPYFEIFAERLESTNLPRHNTDYLSIFENRTAWIARKVV